MRWTGRLWNFLMRISLIYETLSTCQPDHYCSRRDFIDVAPRVSKWKINSDKLERG
jgi:hypothetical protein